MNTNNEAGRKIALGIGIYTIIKAILNAVIGGGLNIGDLLIGIILTAALFTGLKFVNYIAAAFLAIVAIYHLPGNISNIGSNWVYLLEGIADIGCAVLLCLQSDVKEHFTNDLSDLGIGG